jgi:tRNA pseudouridine38-40 synthase
LAPFAWHRPRLVDLDALARAAAKLEGPLDQTVFASSPEGARPVRPIESCTVTSARLVTITVVGRSFLRHAIRGMVGALAEVGAGRRSVADFEALTRGAAHARWNAKGPAHGLCLARVDYE